MSESDSVPFFTEKRKKISVGDFNVKKTTSADSELNEEVSSFISIYAFVGWDPYNLYLESS